MSQPVNIKDSATSVSAKVTSRGELVVSPIEYSTSYAAENNTAITSTVVIGKSKKRFVLTSIFLSQDKTNVDTHITLFESSGEDSDIEDNVIFETDFAKNQTMVATGLGIVTETTK